MKSKKIQDEDVTSIQIVV